MADEKCPGCDAAATPPADYWQCGAIRFEPGGKVFYSRPCLVRQNEDMAAEVCRLNAEVAGLRKAPLLAFVSKWADDLALKKELDMGPMDWLARGSVELERLRAVMDKLPKTADGVPFATAMVVYGIEGNPGTVLRWDSERVSYIDTYGTTHTRQHEFCYSTRAAAEAATEAQRENDD